MKLTTCRVLWGRQPLESVNFAPIQGVFHPGGEFGEQLKSAYIEKMKSVDAFNVA